MTDSYIDLNIEHYLRNGELKGAVKELNTIINGEGSNKSLSELVEDLKIALNYANWGYWGSYFGDANEDNIKPLREAVKRVVEDTDFIYYTETPLIKEGRDYYIDLDKVFKESFKARKDDYQYQKFIAEIRIDVGGTPCWLNYYRTDHSTRPEKYEVSRYDFKDWNLYPKRIAHYEDKESIKSSNGLYKICTFNEKEVTPPNTIEVKLIAERGNVKGGFGRRNKYDIETKKLVDSFD